MRCPFCSNPSTQVRDSRPSEDDRSIRRRRVCPQCNGRFTTFERVQLREITVVKSSGARTPFEREKLERSIQLAVRKRPLQDDAVSRVVNDIVRALESSGDSEVASSQIGELVMAALKSLDSVAYVRFASVYKNFEQVHDFDSVLAELADAPRAGLAAGSAEPPGTEDDDLPVSDAARTVSAPGKGASKGVATPRRPSAPASARPAAE
ncbi:MAG: transcriptional regulator NrdR [Pseudomonadota bacterium]